MAQVRIEHVFKRFGPVTAVNDFNLTVEDGEFVSILGPSGCGKTTSLRMIAGFEKLQKARSISVTTASVLRRRINLFLRKSRYRYGIPVICSLAAYDGC